MHSNKPLKEQYRRGQYFIKKYFQEMSQDNNKNKYTSSSQTIEQASLENLNNSAKSQFIKQKNRKYNKVMTISNKFELHQYKQNKDQNFISNKQSLIKLMKNTSNNPQIEQNTGYKDNGRNELEKINQQAEKTKKVIKQLLIQPFKQFKQKQLYNFSKNNYTIEKAQNSNTRKKINNQNKQLVQQKEKFNVSSHKYSKQRKIYQKIKVLQKNLKSQRQQIKKTRKQFLDLLQLSKVKNDAYDKQKAMYDQKIQKIQTQFQRFQTEKLRTWQQKQTLLYKIQTITKNSQIERKQQKELKIQKSLQIQQKIEQNSAITRKIYGLKQKLQNKKQLNHLLNTKSSANKKQIRKIIQQQENITKLTLQRNLLVFRNKQQHKQRIQQLVQNQRKQQIYLKLETQINLIKSYFKISQNSAQFKKNIKKMTPFDSFYRQIQKFQRLNEFNHEILEIYQKAFWNAQFPRFIQSQYSILQSARIKQLKYANKSLQLKKQSLNQIIKQKEKQVNSLTFKNNKLEQQINKIKQLKQSEYIEESQAIY